MKDILKYSQRMDKHVFLQVSIMLILPISPTTFVISSPDHPLAPKQLLPQKFGINVHLLPSMACIMMVAWAAMVSWYAMMLFVVFGTLYMSKFRFYSVIANLLSIINFVFQFRLQS